MGIFCILSFAVYFRLCAYSSYVNVLLIIPYYFFQIIRTMPPRRSARNAACGRGHGRGRDHGRGDVNQQVNNEQVNQDNEEVEGGRNTQLPLESRRWWCKCPDLGNEVY